MQTEHRDRLLYACTRQQLTGQHRSTVEEICAHHAVDWRAVYTLAEIHGVAPLVYHNLTQCDADIVQIPTAIATKFKQSLFRNMLYKESLVRELEKALTWLHAHDVRVMVLKGAAADLLVYKQPYYTIYTDMDLVLSCHRQDVSDAWAQALMDKLHLTGLEYDYFSHHDITLNGTLPVDFARIWQDATPLEFHGQPIHVMAPDDMLISLCINSVRKRFFRLKSLCDIAETIAAHPHMPWDRFIDKARQYDCQNIIYTVLYITQETVGCRLPPHLLEQLGVSSLRARAIRYLSSRYSLDAYASLRRGPTLLGRHVHSSLLLTYATYRKAHWWQRLLFVLRSDPKGRRRIDSQFSV